MTWTVLVWNMGMGSPSSRKYEQTWGRLSELIDEWSVDVALLNEVSRSILHDADGAVYEVWGTRGRD
jgi:endonuclease/exonuclease/phosphatase family metal-dependent hydrolase